MLPAEFPSTTPSAQQQRISELEEENKMHKLQIEIWKEAAEVK